MFFKEHALIKKSPFFRVNEEVLKKKIEEPLPLWMSERIEEELSAFAQYKLISHPCTYPIFKFSIRNNRLVSPSIWQRVPRVFKMVFFLRKLLSYFPLPDLDFYYTTEDLSENPPFPLFIISKKMNDRRVALFPHVEWICYWNHVRKNFQPIPWEKRENILFWRGATTGADFQQGKNPRRLVVELAQQNRGEIDAFFSSFCQIDPTPFAHLLRENVPIPSQVKYKYLLSLDGNCFGGSFFWQLASGSVIFKHDSPYLEWYYGGLAPFAHYIPFKADGSDLLMQKKWAEKNDLAVKKIAQNAKEFSDQYLSVEGIMAYVYHLLMNYAKVIR